MLHCPGCTSNTPCVSQEIGGIHRSARKATLSRFHFITSYRESQSRMAVQTRPVKEQLEHLYRPSLPWLDTTYMDIFVTSSHKLVGVNSFLALFDFNADSNKVNALKWRNNARYYHSVEGLLCANYLSLAELVASYLNTFGIVIGEGLVFNGNGCGESTSTTIFDETHYPRLHWYKHVMIISPSYLLFDLPLLFFAQHRRLITTTDVVWGEVAYEDQRAYYYIRNPLHLWGECEDHLIGNTSLRNIDYCEEWMIHFSRDSDFTFALNSDYTFTNNVVLLRLHGTTYSVKRLVDFSAYSTSNCFCNSEEYLLHLPASTFADFGVDLWGALGHLRFNTTSFQEHKHMLIKMTRDILPRLVYSWEQALKTFTSSTFLDGLVSIFSYFHTSNYCERPIYGELNFAFIDQLLRLCHHYIFSVLMLALLQAAQYSKTKTLLSDNTRIASWGVSLWRKFHIDTCLLRCV